jgi:hypothetical protein
MISGAQLRGYDHKNNASERPETKRNAKPERRSVVLRPKMTATNQAPF